MSQYSTYHICNTGTINLKTHLRRAESPRTLCGRDVITLNAGDEARDINSVECGSCRRLLSYYSPRTQ